MNEHSPTVSVLAWGLQFVRPHNDLRLDGVLGIGYHLVLLSKVHFVGVLVFLALESLHEVGFLHLVVHVVAGVRADPHNRREGAFNLFGQLGLALDPHVFVPVLGAQMLHKLSVFGEGLTCDRVNLHLFLCRGCATGQSFTPTNN